MTLLLKLLSFLVLFSSPIAFGGIRIVSDSGVVIVDDGLAVEAEGGSSSTTLSVGDGSVFTVDGGHWLALNGSPVVGELTAGRGDEVTVHSGAQDVASPTLQWTLRVVGGSRLREAFGAPRAPRPVIGVTTSALDASLAAQLGVEAADCLVVVTLSAGLPASRAGLAEHDVIVAIDGAAPVTQAALREAILAQGVGGSVQLEVLRQGESLIVEVEVAESGEGVYGQALKDLLVATERLAAEGSAHSLEVEPALRELLTGRQSRAVPAERELAERLVTRAAGLSSAVAARELLTRQRLMSLLAEENALDVQALDLRQAAEAVQSAGLAAREQPVEDLRSPAQLLARLGYLELLDADGQQQVLALRESALARLKQTMASVEEPAALGSDQWLLLRDELAAQQAFMAEMLERREAEVAEQLLVAKDRSLALAARLEAQAAEQLAMQERQREIADRWQGISIIDDPEGNGRSLVLGTGRDSSGISARLARMDERLAHIEKLLSEFLGRAR